MTLETVSEASIRDGEFIELTRGASSPQISGPCTLYFCSQSIQGGLSGEIVFSSALMGPGLLNIAALVWRSLL